MPWEAQQMVEAPFNNRQNKYKQNINKGKMLTKNNKPTWNEKWWNRELTLKCKWGSILSGQEFQFSILKWRNYVYIQYMKKDFILLTAKTVI